MSTADVDVRYLNFEGVWRGFARDGLNLRADGAIALAGLPAPDEISQQRDPRAVPRPTTTVESVAGLAIDVSGNVYYTIPEEHSVYRLDSCTGETTRLPCLGGPGSDPGDLRLPRGLLAVDERAALLICDTGNRRVQLIDPLSGQVLAIWSGLLCSPMAAALDQQGDVYIADADARTVFKVRRDGTFHERFSEHVVDSGLLARPEAVAVVQRASPGVSSSWVYVLDRAQRTVFVFDEHGHPVSDASGQRLSIGAGLFSDPIALTANTRSLHVLDRGDDGLTRVLCFEVGSSHALVGEVAALTGARSLFSLAGRLWFQRAGEAPTPWLEQTAFCQLGHLESPAVSPGRAVAFTSLHLDTEPLPPGAHVQLWFRISDAPDGGAARWQPGPRDALHVHLGDRTGHYLWVRIQLSGDGVVTPVLRNASVRFDQPGYLAKLPAIYNAAAPSRDFLLRFLSLFESFNVELDDAIEQLPRLFDPRAIDPASLPWLSSWLAVELDERWSTDKQRAAIVRAYQEDAARGTAEGLRRAIQFETELSCVLVEPILHSAWWALPGSESACAPEPPQQDDDASAGSVLGFTTMLAAAEPDSAVVETSTLDHSRILHEADYGVPLFDDAAHQFVAHVYRGAADIPATRAALVQLIEREKPAHTSFRLSSIEPRFAVGVQASVGFDTVVAGPVEPTALGGRSGPLQLAGEPAPRIGTRSRVGQGLRL